MPQPCGFAVLERVLGSRCDDSSCDEPVEGLLPGSSVARFVQRSHLRVEARLALALRLVQAQFAVHVEPQVHVGLGRRPQRELLLHNMTFPSHGDSVLVEGEAMGERLLPKP